MFSFLSNISIAPLWLWITFSVSIFVLLFIDLFIFGQKNEKVSTKKALKESGFWILLSLLFNAWFFYEFGPKLGVEFLTGYLVEKSLSVDNLFIILLIFKSLKVPDSSQHKVLFWGVFGAVVFRAIFILIGAQLLHSFDWILYLFGAILLITGIKFLFEGDDKDEVKDSFVIKSLKKVLPTTSKFEGSKLFIKENGKRLATPLFMALIAIEVTDIIFAVDSIPAVFSITQDAFIAFSSNILAVLGLRALYFVLADMVGRLRYLKPGLAAILGFIGIKMLLIDLFHIPSWVSLLVIIAILVTASLSSWYVSRNKRQ